jgi:type IV pilus assembly protein PilE
MSREMQANSMRAALHRTQAAGRSQGFTLIEMMIVVAIVAILAAVVVPSYQSYVVKARRTEAKSALTQAAQSLERFATENAASGYSTATLGPTGVFPNRSESGYYALSISGQSVSGFTLQATPQGAQAGDAGCANFILDQRGARSVSGSKTWQECWQ